MSSEKSWAVVIRVVDFSESSCIVTLFTEGFGKISALAKGARRPKGPFEAAIDLLAVCRVVFLHKSSDVLDLLTEAKLEKRFRAAANSLPRLYAGYYVAELLNALTDENDPCPTTFRATLEVLEALDTDANIPSSLLRFELILLHQLGHFPTLSECAGCGQEVDGQRVPFGHLAGGVLCSTCRLGKRQVVMIRQETIQLLNQYVQPEWEDWRTVSIPPSLQGELNAVVRNYLSHLMGKRPRMFAYLPLMHSEA